MHLLRSVALAALALTACKPATEPTPAQTPTTDAAAGPMLIGGRLVLPAVAGNPAAAYFTLANASDKPISVRGANVERAERAEMHETSGTSMKPLATVAVAAATSAMFEPGGKHLMVFGVPSSVKPGDEVQLTLTLADGRTLSAPLTAESPGMAMDHGDMH